MVLFAVLALGCKEKAADEAKPENPPQATKATPPKADTPAPPKAAPTPATAGDAIIAQAKPVYELINAVATEDADGLMKAFSSTQRKKFEGEGGKATLAVYRDAFAQVLGEDYKASDFKLSYEGDDSSGAVTANFKDKSLPPLKVVNEGGVWGIAEN